MLAQEVGPELVIDHPEAGAFFAANVETDNFARHRLMKVLGSVAVENTLNSPEQMAAEEASLPAVAEDYFSGEAEKVTNAKARLKADLKTNIFEILCADGHISPSYSTYDQDGFYQNGYSQRAMYAHGTLHTNHEVEHRRRTAETLNELRIEDGYRNGYFNSYYFVEISRTPDEEDMTKQKAEDNGYNTATYKAMLRVTEVDQFGRRVSVSAPVSGVNSEGQRHDKEGVKNIHDQLNLSPDDESASATLEGAFWVSKAMLPNGVVDLARFYDESLGKSAFFGVEGKIGNYDTIVAESLAREQRILDKLEAKVDKLAADLYEKDCMTALKTMAIHAKDFAAEVCAKDPSYDPKQFGEKAAQHIVMARLYNLQGDSDGFHFALQAARQTAVVYMCGMRLAMEKQTGDNLENQLGTATNNKPEPLSEEDCDFISLKCPECGTKNVKTKVATNSITRKRHVSGSCGCKKTYDI